MFQIHCFKDERWRPPRRLFFDIINMILLLCCFALILSVIMLAVLLSIMCNDHVESVVKMWNLGRGVENERRVLNGVPGYYDGGNGEEGNLTTLLWLNHKEILGEVMKVLEQRREKGDRVMYIGMRWWGEWAKDSEECPILKNIVGLFPEVSSLYVMVLYPGASLIERRGEVKALETYEYGLSLPEQDIDGKISTFDVLWKEGKGYIWDGTTSYTVWNHGTKEKIMIFADIFRGRSWLDDIYYYVVKRKNLFVPPWNKNAP